MVNRTVFTTFLVCALLFGAAVWFFMQQEPAPLAAEMMGPTVPAAPAPVSMVALPAPKDIAQIERQIEQVKVQRDQPEVVNLENLLAEFEEDPSRWDILIAVGDVYRKGAYPRFIPNEELAARIFKIAAMCPDGSVAGMAQSKYIETYDDPINSLDKQGSPLPQEVGLRICELAENAIKTTPWHLFEKPRIQKRAVEPVALPPMNNVFDDMFLDLAVAQAREPSSAPPKYRIDGQNVHDHGVTKVTNFNIENLKKEVDIRKLNQTDNQIGQVVNAILSHPELDSKTKEEALHVIENLGDSRHGSFDVTERDALVMVWDKINKNPNMRGNLTETLAKQLSSSIENGHIVCSSGKITRIMSTLDGVSNEASRPMWAIREELANKAAKIREEMTEKYGDTPEAGRRMKDAFESEVKNDYINKLGMSEKVINPLISEYEMGF